MALHIQSRSYPLTRALELSIQDNLLDILERYQQITLLDVRLENINSNTHGGIDKRCQALVRMSNSPEFIIRSTKEDMYHAIQDCAGRVKHTLSRRVMKQRKIFRQVKEAA